MVYVHQWGADGCLAYCSEAVRPVSQHFGFCPHLPTRPLVALRPVVRIYHP